MKLKGKVAVVTGGSSGLALASAKRFIAEGAYVFITGRRRDVLESAARDLGPQARAVQGDVSKMEDLDRLFSVVQQERGDRGVRGVA